MFIVEDNRFDVSGSVIFDWPSFEMCGLSIGRAQNGVRIIGQTSDMFLFCSDNR